MANTAVLPLVADRYQPCVRTIYLVGIDITGLDMRAQVRLAGDTPGAPLVDLLTVTNGNAEGLRLVEVTTTNGLPTSTVEMVINETTMEALPYMGELGDSAEMRWDWQVVIAGRKRRLAKGGFVVLGDGVTGADYAPIDRLPGYGSQRAGGGTWQSAKLTFGAENVTVQIDGADLIAPLVKQAQDARDAVKPLFGNGAPAAGIGIVGSAYYDITDPLNPVFYGPKTSSGWGVGRGLKGNPGGNVSAIGPFTSASALTIPSGTDVVRTSGYAAAGDGGAAYYRRVAAQPSHPGKFQSTTGGQWWEIDEPSLSLAMFGYKADGATDDTDAWKRGIAVATAKSLKTIRVPWGAAGVSVVAGQIINGIMAPGLEFVGEGRGLPNAEWIHRPQLKYTGTGTCWFINHAGENATSGYWTWKNITFRATTAKGTMFDFNDAATGRVVTDSDQYSYLKDITFDRCFFYGGHGGANQTGDAIRAAKAFNLRTMTTCFFRGWRRAPWLYGCDNCTLSHEAFLNACCARLEASGTFGNDNEITSRFFGSSPSAASEDVYKVWDNCNSTVIRHFLYEDNLGNDVAAIYINGYETLIEKMHIGDLRPLRVGPQAREWILLAPSITAPLAAPIVFDEPASWDFGNEQTDYRGLVIGATRNIRTAFGSHPRLLYGNKFPATAPDKNYGIAVDQEQDFISDARGTRPRRRRLSALNFWSRSTGTLSNSGPSSMVPSDTASGGWVIKLASGAASGGLAMRLLLGRELMPGDRVKVTIRLKSTDTNGWYSSVSGNGGDAVNRPIGPGTGEWQFKTWVDYLDPATWAVGETYSHDIYRGAVPNGDCLIDFIEYEVLPTYVTAADFAAASAAGVGLKDIFADSTTGALRVRLA
jgi:hypothetical protein